MKVYFATRVRGFFKHLFAERDIHAEFTGTESSVYETNSQLRTFLSRCVRSRLGDWLGIVQRVRCQKTGCDIHGSYNRFLSSDKPYFIYVENPTALYHYSLGRKHSLLGRRTIKRNLADPNLKALIFMSQACAKTFEAVCGTPSPTCLQEQIYPLIPQNPHVSEGQIKNRRNRDDVRLLYIAQGIRFLSKGALEVLEAYRRLRESGARCSLTMVTNISQVDSAMVRDLQQTDGVKLRDFQFSYSEMEQLYADHDILLQPTSDESFGLTVLEALHAGLAIVASRLYAIPELVKEGVNGCLVDPAYWFFDWQNVPNPKVWNHRRDTIYSGRRSESVAKALYDCLAILVHDRELLVRMSLASYRMSCTAPFCRDYIVAQWNEVLGRIHK